MTVSGKPGQGSSGSQSPSVSQGSSGSEGVTDALERLRNRLSAHREGEVDPFELLGENSHPFADLKRLAILWRHAHAETIETPETTQTVPGPATIAVVAEKLGLDVIWETLSLPSLNAHDLPAVVLLRNGSSRLVIGRPQEHSFQVLGPEGAYLVPVKALALLATGTVFRVRSIAAQAPEEAAQEIEAARPSSAPAAGDHGASAQNARPNTFSLKSFFMGALRGQGKRLVHLCLAAFLINLLGMALPLFSMAVFDRVIPHAAMDTLIALALGVSLALVLEMALRHARLKLVDAVGLGASFALQSRLTGRLLFARAAEVPRAGGLILPASQELEALSQIVPQLIVSACVDLPFFILMMVFIATIGGPVVFAPLLGALFLVLIHAFGHAMAHRSHASSMMGMRRHMQMILDSIAGVERIRVTGAGRSFLSKWDQVADDAGFAAHQGRYWHGLSGQASAVLVQVVIVSTIVIGVFRIDSATMTIGALSAVMLLVNRAMMPISILIGLVYRAKQGVETVSHIMPLLNANLEAGGDQRVKPANAIRGQVSLHAVSARYPGETRFALRDVSLVIRPGERVGLIGKAGCGKSTLLKLIARLNDPSDGRLTLDDRDIRHYDPGEMRHAISHMPQDAHLLDLSLHENLTIGLQDVSPELFERVTKLCGVHEFAAGHPAGYSLLVGPGGQRLSGGERQSVSLARALMGGAPLLLLDEPTSALDNGLEARIIAELKKTLGSTGLIVATHRLPLLALVDRIIWLDGGRIVADGPKDQVFTKMGLAA